MRKTAAYNMHTLCVLFIAILSIGCTSLATNTSALGANHSLKFIIESRNFENGVYHYDAQQARQKSISNRMQTGFRQFHVLHMQLNYKNTAPIELDVDIAQYLRPFEAQIEKQMQHQSRSKETQNDAAVIVRITDNAVYIDYEVYSYLHIQSSQRPKQITNRYSLYQTKIETTAYGK